MNRRGGAPPGVAALIVISTDPVNLQCRMQIVRDKISNRDFLKIKNGILFKNISPVILGQFIKIIQRSHDVKSRCILRSRILLICVLTVTLFLAGCISLLDAGNTMTTIQMVVTLSSYILFDRVSPKE